MTEITRLGARLKAARKAAGFNTSKSFITKHKVPASTYSQHESGSRMPDDEALKFYSKIFDVNFNWLKKGEGHPYTKISSEKKQIFNEELIDLTNFGQYSKTINKDLLATIFEELFKLNQSPLSNRLINKILTKSIHIYNKIVSSGSTEDQQRKLLRSKIATYK